MANWEQRGNNVINAGTGFVVGIGRGLMGIGGRVKREKHRKFFNSFCALIGAVIAQNGQIKPEEIEELKNFLLNNRNNNAIGCWDAQEIINSVKDYAIKFFTGDNDSIVRAIEVQPGSDYAKITILGALAIAFADGECDTKEAKCIYDHATQLQIDLDQLGRELNIQMPQFGNILPSSQQVTYVETPQPIQTPPQPIQTPPQPIQTPPQPIQTPPQPTQPLSSGDPCPMCKGVNASKCVFCKGTGKKRKI